MTSASLVTKLQRKLMISPPVEEDPRLLNNRQKAIVLIGIALCAGTPGFSSTIYFPGLPSITQDLNAPPIATTLTAALFILAMGIAPVFWASISDHFQIRRFLLILSMTIFAVSSLGSAFINNIWGLVVLRCVQSVGSSCSQSVGAGVVADCYPIEQRGAAFGKFFFGVFIGPLIGPIVGGFLIMSDLSWRATFWFCFALACFIILYLLILFPETYRPSERFDVKLPVTLQDDNSSSSTIDYNNNQNNQQNEKVTQVDQATTVIKKQRVNPIAAFILLRHPFVLLASIISGIAFGAMFAVETIIPDLYETRYGFNSWQTGLSYLGAGIGNVCGTVLGGYLSDRLLLRARARRGGKAVVEDRLTLNLWPASICIIFGLLLFGWSITHGLTVWAPIVAFGIQNFGMNQVMTATSAYLVDAMPGNAASSASAAANFARMVMACAFTLAANPMVNAINPGWTCVFLTGLSVIALILLSILKVYGARLREWSGFGDKE